VAIVNSIFTGCLAPEHALEALPPIQRTVVNAKLHVTHPQQEIITRASQEAASASN
jgi:hypothetical protein